jgi:hypothetical protein
MMLAQPWMTAGIIGTYARRVSSKSGNHYRSRSGSKPLSRRWVRTQRALCRRCSESRSVTGTRMITSSISGPRRVSGPGEFSNSGAYSKKQGQVVVAGRRPVR